MHVREGMSTCLHELSPGVDGAQHDAAEHKAGNDALPIRTCPGRKDEDGQLAVGGRKVHIRQRSSKSCTRNAEKLEVGSIGVRVVQMTEPPRR